MSICDFADELHNSLQATFPGITVLTKCYPHLIRAIVRRGKKQMKDPFNNDQVKADVRSLSEITSGVEFEHAVSLFLRHWQGAKKEHEFVAYFQEQYLGRHRSWYVGVNDPGLPTTNNALESHNRKLKEEGTQHKLTSIGVFLKKMSVLLQHYSVELCDQFPNFPTIPNQVWEDAQVWGKDYARFVVTKDGKWYCPTPSYMQWYQKNEDKNQLKTDLASYINNVNLIRGDSFKKYMKRRGNFITLQLLPQPVGEYIHFSCTCVAYFKKAVCEHVVGWGLVKKKFNLPVQKNLQLLQARKRNGGAPKKSGPCLNREAGVTRKKSRKGTRKSQK